MLVSAIAALVGVGTVVWVIGHGLPETMREVALWLLRQARRLEASRARNDAETAEGLKKEIVQ